MSVLVLYFLFALFIYFISTPIYARLLGFNEQRGTLQHTPFTITVGFGACLATLLLAYLYFTGDYNHEQELGHILATMACALTGIALLIETLGSYGEYDDCEIRYKTLWRGTRTFAWEDLQSYENLGDQVRIRFKDGSVVKVYVVMGGYGFLLEALEKHSQSS